MSLDPIEQLEIILDKKYPDHVKVGDKVEMYDGNWELRDTGTVLYVGPGYATVEFWKTPNFNGEIKLRLTQESGTIDRMQVVHGYTFRGTR